MADTDTRTVTRQIECDYTMVAEARGQRVLWFRRFGSYEGEWLLLALDEGAGQYLVYKGWYGSCSGCDAIESEFVGPVDPDSEQTQRFIEGYRSFLEMSREAALRVAARDGNLLSVLPANQPALEETAQPAVGRQLALAVLVHEGAIRAPEILEIDNLEGRREAIEGYGAASFVLDVGAGLVARDGDDALYAVDRPGADKFAFLYVKDASTERRYVIRVAPEHQTVRAARAASFGIPEDRFVLAQET